MMELQSEVRIRRMCIHEEHICSYLKWDKFVSNAETVYFD